MKEATIDRAYRDLGDELRKKVSGLAGKRPLLPEFVEQLIAAVGPRELVEAGCDASLALFQYFLDLGLKRKVEHSLVHVEDGSFSGDLSRAAIFVITHDRPFLVDSILAELAAQRLEPALLSHPTMSVTRNGEGVLTQLSSKEASDSIQESWILIQLVQRISPERVAELKTSLATVVTDVCCAVDDWQQMVERTVDACDMIANLPPEIGDAENRQEVLRFLDWIRDNHFTLTGAREVTFEKSPDGKRVLRALKEDSRDLGVLKRHKEALHTGSYGTSLAEHLQKLLLEPLLLRVSKSIHKSLVHRRASLDTFAIKRFDAKGQVIGESIFCGLFTSKAVDESALNIPFLGGKIASILKQSGLEKNSHAYRNLEHVIDTYPREELFEASIPDLARITLDIVKIQQRARVSVFCREDKFAKSISVLVYLPKTRSSARLQGSIGTYLEETFSGKLDTTGIQVGDDVLARYYYVVLLKDRHIPDFDPDEIEAHIDKVSESWEDRFQRTLIGSMDSGAALQVWDRFSPAFPPSYKEAVSADEAANDIELIEATLTKKIPHVRFFWEKDTDGKICHVLFRLFHPDKPIILSNVMPIFDNFSANVMTEAPFPVELEEGTVLIHQFELDLGPGLSDERTLEAVRVSFEEGLLAVVSGAAEDDSFNGLVLRVGLNWRQVVVLRGLGAYLRQVGIPFVPLQIASVLRSYPDIVRNLVRLFETRFALTSDNREKDEAALTQNTLEALDAVSSRDHDRILRHYLNLILAIRRTNFHQRDRNGDFKPWLSFKISSRDVDSIPKPAPLFEIFVYSPRFEAVHLRFGQVARGGLRWSDRESDFRTEILGLVKAQQVKNAVIVPVGSKGGFVLKHPPEGRPALMEEGIFCYRMFIESLLDLTDNYTKDGVAKPVAVYPHDGDDPYLVVAADKGTATFSDYANEIAVNQGFWLGDAFASGGSVGYDHKKMGITARGAWESVKRHFREMEINTQEEEFTVAGIGDMGGDVFGNGMLLSPHIRLVAAFNHLHIFLDPSPNAAVTFEERKRLFDDVKGWGDYDISKLSKGGQIYERSAKSLKLTPEIRDLLDLEREQVAPDQLLTAILESRVDLLWFGGIGTYIKHSLESHSDAGDRANDAIRINGCEVRAKVIGEGANLGVTHRARIEFAENGGRVNTDAIDNSAGVDCSDHEVNIKILIRQAVENGSLREQERSRTLAEMTSELGQLLLNDNYQQTQAVTIMEVECFRQLDDQQELIRHLESIGELDRGLEFLPSDDLIVERRAGRGGLLRPELAVILAYAKNWIYRQVLESDLPDDRSFESMLITYFPTLIQERFHKEIFQHRLRREIIATILTNHLVNRGGAAFTTRAARSGRSLTDIIRAFFIVEKIFDLPTLWDNIEALDNQAPAALQAKMHVETWRTLDRVVGWFLATHRTLDVAEHIGRYQQPVSGLRENLLSVLPATGREALTERIARFEHKQAPSDLSQHLGSLKTLSSGCEIVELAKGHAVTEVAQLFYACGDRFHLEWLKSQANLANRDTLWTAMAIDAGIDDLWSLQSDLVAKTLSEFGSDSKSPSGNLSEAFANFVEAEALPIKSVDELLAEVRALGRVDVPILTVANRQLRALTQ